MMEKGSLTRMFQEGASIVPLTRTSNLLQELDTRQLTEEEQHIINHRVALQRRMLAAFEKQEQARKREQLREVHPGLTDQEADRALELCNGREDEAADHLASSPSFLRSLRVQNEARPEMQRPKSQVAESQQAKSVARKPVTYQPIPQRHPDEQMFVGVFRGRSMLPEVGAEEASSQDMAQPFMLCFGNVPRQSRSRIRRQRRRIALPIETSTETQSTGRAEDTVLGGGLHHWDRLRQRSDDSADLTCLATQHFQAEGARDCEVESPLKETPDDQIVNRLKRLGLGKGLEYLNTLSDNAVHRILLSLEGSDTNKANQLRARFKAQQPPAKCSEASPAQQSGSNLKEEPTSARPKRKAAMNAAGFNHAVLAKSESETETDEEMYGPRFAKRKKTSDNEAQPARPDLQQAAQMTRDPAIESTDVKEEAASSSRGSGGAPPLALVKRPRGPRAISVRGHTNRGRVRQKSHKSAELVTVGRLRLEDGWHNQGYIFPEGFTSRVNFRSSVELDQLCVHECSVLGEEGEFWPQPTFKVVAMDRPEEPLIAKSCTGCWTGILKRINAVIEAKRKAGENLPPPPKTAIAGPEYFGFNQHEISIAVEALDKERSCEMYWQGKSDRKSHAAGLPIAGQTSVATTQQHRHRSAASRSKHKQRSGSCSEDSEEDGEGGNGDEAANVASKWAAVSRHERYRQRCGGEFHDQGNPIPGWVDPITLEPVVTPAISPFGHIMGLATWKAVLSDFGKCPFTKKTLRAEQCHVLTKANISRFANRIIADKETLQRFGLQEKARDLASS